MEDQDGVAVAVAKIGPAKKKEEEAVAVAKKKKEEEEAVAASKLKQACDTATAGLKQARQLIQKAELSERTKQDMLVRVARNETLIPTLLTALVELNPDMRIESLNQPEWIADPQNEECGRMKSWQLGGARLVALPEEFGQLSVVELLDLSHNKLEALPVSFGGISCSTLRLNNNALSELPESFGELCVAEDVSLRANNLTSVPAPFVGIKVGGYLNLGANQITTVPDDFAEINLGGELLLDGNPMPDGDQIKLKHDIRRRQQVKKASLPPLL